MGEIITFYSYKGGTGRTMALANIAYLLSKQSDGRVLMMDWDLEAPGLFTYFEKYCTSAEEKEGLIEFMIKAKATLNDMPLRKENHEQLNSFFAEIENYLIKLNINGDDSNLFLLKAGNETEDYSNKIQNFDWKKFFKNIPAFFTAFAHYLSTHFDYVLIDSRTGHTDIGGICTMLMPDKLVLTFTPNNQSLNGVLKLAKKAVKYRHSSFDIRPLKLYPLPSRVDLEEEDLRIKWEGLYKQNFTNLFEDIYQLPWISLEAYFDKVQIRHSSKYAYEESIATITGTSSPNSLQKNYEEFKIQLEKPVIWEEKPFASLESPLQGFVIYTDKDKMFYEELRIHLKSIEREGGIFFSDFNDIPIDKWNELNGSAVKNLNQGFDIIFKIVTPDLIEQQKKWQDTIDEVSEKVDSIYILAEPTDNHGRDVNDVLPKYGDAISVQEDKDSTWLNLTKEIRSSILDSIYKKLKTPTDA